MLLLLAGQAEEVREVHLERLLLESIGSGLVRDPAGVQHLLA